MQKIHKVQEQRDGVPAQHRTTARAQRSGKCVIFHIGRHDTHTVCHVLAGYLIRGYRPSKCMFVYTVLSLQLCMHSLISAFSY